MTQPRRVTAPSDPAAGRVAAALRAPRLCIERISPQVDHGRCPAKATVGQALAIEADIFMDGHDQVAAQVIWHEGAVAQALPMRALGNDRWRVEAVPQGAGRCRFTIEAWLDRWGSFRHGLARKAAAGVPIKLELEEGRALIREAAQQPGPAAGSLAALSRELATLDDSRTLDLFLGEATAALMRAGEPRRFVTRSQPELEVEVERTRAGFAAWYELFPRSCTRDPARHGTFDDVIARLPAIKAMGFDVLYFPPIHPIGASNRKGPNNSLKAGPGDPGSPYAIGSSEGGHTAVHPQLGGIEAFRRLHAAAGEAGIEIALDFAVQFSPDHPWLRDAPHWFAYRPDGSIRFAENPPKKYQDIVNCEFYADSRPDALWQALRDVILHWVDAGVKIFRVDNPHTKPLPFWQWLIEDVRGRHPDVMFLAEAFTRPAMMYRLAKIGFSQSYTYFTWRNTRAEFIEYLTELTQGPPKDFYRPHFFVNTPDINPYFLQTSGRAGFVQRAALAATLSGLWGLYSGFELCEAAPLPGKEEYLDSEKYQIRVRDWNAPGNIVGEITRLNHIRRENPALQSHLGLTFLQCDNDQVLYFAKHVPDRSNYLLVAISLDPHQAQEAYFDVPLAELGLPDDGALEVEELMRGERFTWRGKRQHWRFVPWELPLAIWRVKPA
ncbi:MAG TPA: alpha-1,4-glucan--maltose-1-phosphate maltosyltransferase [Verrucomicrobiae bacterium]|nr:alpha-1,4-glucan--maltose-1-phosphate maltosyltransferase [Verrucomicrobiae bacterium]